jgi:hypothetical protein
VNVTLIVQLAPVATLEPQVLVCSKLAVIAIASMWSVAEPVLLTMIDCGPLVSLTNSSAKVKLATDKVAVGDPSQVLSRHTTHTASTPRRFIFVSPLYQEPQVVPLGGKVKKGTIESRNFTEKTKSVKRKAGSFDISFG